MRIASTANHTPFFRTHAFRHEYGMHAVTFLNCAHVLLQPHPICSRYMINERRTIYRFSCNSVRTAQVVEVLNGTFSR